jgi:predicted transcriptional regulator
LPVLASNCSASSCNVIFLLINDTCSQKAIINFTKLSSSTVSWHLKKLISKNIISSIKNGRESNYKLLSDKNEIINLLVIYKEGFFDSLVDRVIEMWDIR